MSKKSENEVFDGLTAILCGEGPSDPQVNPAHFLQLIQDHRLISRLAPYAAQFQDENLREAIHTASLANKIYQLRLVRTLHEIHEFLAPVPFIVLKGPVLSQCLYQDPAERTSRDLDLLVEKTRFDEALQRFLDRKYTLLTPFKSEKQRAAILTHFHHVELLDPTGEVLVELHWNITAMKSIRVNIPQLMSHTALVKIGELEYRTLEKFDLMAYLAVHATFHAFARLQWLCDIRDLRATFTEEEETELLHYMESEGLANFYLLALALIENVFKIPVRQDWLDRVHSTPSAQALYQLARAEMRKNDTYLYGEESLGGLDNTLKHHRIQYHTGGFKGLIQSLIARNVRPKNWEFYVFPDKVFGLNHLLSRPIWLYRKLFSKKP
jgi:hypothetical protein